MPKARAISRLPIGVVLSMMNASNSSRLGTRPLAIGSSAGWPFFGLGLHLLLGRDLLLLAGHLLGRILAGVVGSDGRRLLGPRGLGLLPAATAVSFGGAFGEQRQSLVDRQLLGLQIARHGGVDAGVLDVHAVAAVIELDRRFVGGMVADDANRLHRGAAASAGLGLAQQRHGAVHADVEHALRGRDR